MYQKNIICIKISKKNVRFIFIVICKIVYKKHAPRSTGSYRIPSLTHTHTLLDLVQAPLRLPRFNYYSILLAL